MLVLFLGRNMQKRLQKIAIKIEKKNQSFTYFAKNQNFTTMATKVMTLS